MKSAENQGAVGADDFGAEGNTDGQAADPIKGPRVADALWHGLDIIARHHGRAVNRDTATAGLPLVDGCLTPSLMPRAAKRAGLKVHAFAGDWRKIEPAMLPCILLLKGDTACVLLKREGAGARVIEAGRDGSRSMPGAELDALYTGRSLFLRPEFRFDERSPPVGEVTRRHWFWSAIFDNAPLYRDVLVAAFMINLFAVAMPLFVMNVYDRVVPNGAIDTLWMLAIGLIIVQVGELALRGLRSYFIDLASNRVDVRLSARIMERVLGLRLAERPAAAGSFAANLRSFETVRDFITSATVTTLIDLPFGIIFVLVIAWIGLPLVVPLLIGSVLILLYAWSVQGRLHALTEESYRAGAQRNATLIESLVGLETLKILGAEGVMQRKWEESVSFLARVGIQLRTLAASSVHGAMWIQQVATAMVVVIGVYLATENALTLGGIIAAMMLSARGMAPVGQVAGLLTQYHLASTALSALDDVMQRTVERPEGSKFLSRPRLNGDIEFRDVRFGYPGADVEALRGISFRVKAGEHVALIGRIGSGKTTINKLIMGLYQPDSGAVLVDGIDLRQLDPADLRRQIGHVPQECTLFYGTLRENLTMGQPDANDARVLRAAELAGIKDFVDAHPRGFDMLISERGESLSGGQRQGIVLARACLREPPVLLLDEPTGAMDHSGEEAVKRALEHFAEDRTMLLITHRTPLLELVDRIIVVDGGRIVADGPKAQVLDALRQGRIGKAQG